MKAELHKRVEELSEYARDIIQSGSDDGIIILARYDSQISGTCVASPLTLSELFYNMFVEIPEASLAAQVALEAYQNINNNNLKSQITN